MSRILNGMNRVHNLTRKNQSLPAIGERIKSHEISRRNFLRMSGNVLAVAIVPAIFSKCGEGALPSSLIIDDFEDGNGYCEFMGSRWFSNSFDLFFRNGILRAQGLGYGEGTSQFGVIMLKKEVEDISRFKFIELRARGNVNFFHPNVEKKQEGGLTSNFYIETITNEFRVVRLPLDNSGDEAVVLNDFSIIMSNSKNDWIEIDDLKLLQ